MLAALAQVLGTPQEKAVAWPNLSQPIRSRIVSNHF
jgi:hypothetical protein